MILGLFIAAIGVPALICAISFLIVWTDENDR